MFDLIWTSNVHTFKFESQELISQGRYHRRVNPIPAGILENQDMLGGGQFDPPPLNPFFMSKYDKWYIIIMLENMLEKSENFNSLRPILFELCKKNYKGGANWPPPSAGIGLSNNYVSSRFWGNHDSWFMFIKK